VITIPIFVNLAMRHFMGQESYIPLQFAKVLEVVAIILIPVAIGMLINSRFPLFAQRMDKPVKIASALLLFALVILILIKERSNLVSHFADLGAPTLAFNIISLLAGYYIAKAYSLTEADSRAIAFEIGVHNGTLAIYLAINVLGSAAMAVPAAIYSILMFITAFMFGAWLNRR
jgi:BASS family bile acid:Na+ symporter